MKLLTLRSIAMAALLTSTACKKSSEVNVSAIKDATSVDQPSTNTPSTGSETAKQQAMSTLSTCEMQQTASGITLNCPSGTFTLNNGQKGDAGAQGIQGVAGSNGQNGVGCTTSQASGGVNVICGNVTTFVSNGSNGTNGQDGAGCTTTQVSGGINVTCGATTTFVASGAVGPQGPAGAGAWDVYNASDSRYTDLLAISLAGGDTNYYLVAYSKSAGAMVAYKRDGGIFGGTVWYEFANCTGKMYMGEAYARYSNSIVSFDRSSAGFANDYYKASGARRTFSPQSKKMADGTCGVGTTSAEFVEVTSYTLPIQVPTAVAVPVSVRPAL